MKRHNRMPIKPQFPYVTALFILVLGFFFLAEPHPHTTIGIGQYIFSAFSSYNIHMFYGEVLLLAIGGFVAEQYMSGSLLAAFILIIGPAGDWLVEITHPNTLVLGMSTASMGLIAFSLLAVFGSLVYYSENLIVRIMLSLFLSYGVLELVMTFWGSYIGKTIYQHQLYHPNTAYLAHLFGVAAGLGLWVFLHKIYGVE